MRVIDAIAEILKREGVEYLNCYPTTALIEACAAAGIRPLVCRQERVGAGMADGYSRTANGRPAGVFAMQYGPGAENAFPGVATAFSDSVPMLFLPLGHPREQAQVFPLFSSARTYASVTKHVETLNVPARVADVMRRAFSVMKMGRPGPVMVEIPADVATEDIGDTVDYTPVRTTQPMGNPQDIAAAAEVLLQAQQPILHAGQGVLYAEASAELAELAEVTQAPVMTTLEGKSAFPEDHPLALGTGGGVMPGTVHHFLRQADVVCSIGSSLTRHGMSTNIPPGKVIIHATNDERDLNKNYATEHPILGDAKHVLRQLIEAVKDLTKGTGKPNDGAKAAEVQHVREAWLTEWMPTLTSKQTPITPYRVIWEFMQTVNPSEAVVTHDSGSPRDQLIPFYRATAPRGYMGWGKSHALGTGLGLIIGAKLAVPDKFCVNFMGDAAFGMTGLDFETAARCGIPITTVVLNNSSMAIETEQMRLSHERYQTRDIGGDYAAMGRAMGGYAERVEDPNEIAAAFQRVRRANDDGQAALLEFITSEERAFSHRRPF